jgi:cardiolipin synthase
MASRDGTIKAEPPLTPTGASPPPGGDEPLPGGPTFARGLWRIAGAEVTCGNATTLLGSDATFEVALADIAAAKQSIDLEVYIYHGDRIGHGTTDALVAAAKRGVAIRVLMDYVGSWGRGGGAMASALRQAGAQVRLFNPPGFRAWLGALPRDHRKVLVVDGAIGITGGVNVGDEWRSWRRALAWRDTTVRIVGPAAQDLQASFERMWRLAEGTAPTLSERRKARRLVRAPRNAWIPFDAEPALIGIIEGEPGKFRVSRALQYQAVAAQKTIWLASAYFIPGGAEIEALSGAARDGVDVRVLVPSTTDHPWVRRFSRLAIHRLRENGVRIWEWRGAMMHAKTSVVDSQIVRVGSTDFNPLGISINYELDALILDRKLGAAADAAFLEDLSQSREITSDR